jgi:hypothetical protein
VLTGGSQCNRCRGFPAWYLALDPLQQDVDPKLLVPSRAKGPGARHGRKIPTHMPAKGRVNVHHIFCVHVLDVSLLSWPMEFFSPFPDFSFSEFLEKP